MLKIKKKNDFLFEIKFTIYYHIPMLKPCNQIHYFKIPLSLLSSQTNIWFMLKIDMHSHIIPKNLPDWHGKFGYGDFIYLKHNEDKTADMM